MKKEEVIKIVEIVFETALKITKLAIMEEGKTAIEKEKWWGNVYGKDISINESSCLLSLSVC